MLIEDREGQGEQGVRIELTPMIDMVFLLLIFFLIATTFHQAEREMSVALPTAGATQPISAALRELIINVGADGTVIVGGQPRTLEELGDIVEQRVAANPQQKVSIRGDRAAPYAYIVQVLDVCKAASVSAPFLDTVFTDR